MTEENLRKLFGANIKRLRSKNNLTQEAFAEKTDVSIPFLSDIENARKWVSPNTLTKFALVLGVEPFELFQPSDAVPAEVGAVLDRFAEDALAEHARTLRRLCDFYKGA